MKKVIKDVLSCIWKGLNVGSVCFLSTFLYVYFSLTAKEELDTVFSYYLNIMFSAAVIFVLCLIAFYVFAYFIVKKRELPIWVWCILSCILCYAVFLIFLVVTDIPFNTERFIVFTVLLIICETVTYLLVYLYQRYRKALAARINERIKAGKTEE